MCGTCTVGERSPVPASFSKCRHSSALAQDEPLLVHTHELSMQVHSDVIHLSPVVTAVEERHVIVFLS